MEIITKISELPWQGLGVHFEHEPTTGHQIITEGHLDYTTSLLPMSAEGYNQIPGYYAIQKDDTHSLLGVIHKYGPIITQNIEAFKPFDYFINNGTLKLDSCNVLDNGSKVFCVFKMTETYNIFDDEFNHYLVAVNNHLDPFGGIWVYHTPVRIVCTNMLTSVLSKNVYAFKVPVSKYIEQDTEILNTCINHIHTVQNHLDARAKRLEKIKLSDNSLELVMDAIFPLAVANESNVEMNLMKQNERVMEIRDTFISDYLDSTDLSNYRNTMYGLYNAFEDWSQHAYKKLDKSLDINYRMKQVRGLNQESSPAQKMLQLEKQIKQAA